MAPRTKPKPIWCGEISEHDKHEYVDDESNMLNCAGYVSPKKKEQEKEPDDVEDLNKIWVPISELRMELAKITKEGYERYPLGELMLKIREIIRRNDGTGT